MNLCPNEEATANLNVETVQSKIQHRKTEVVSKAEAGKMQSISPNFKSPPAVHSKL